MSTDDTGYISKPALDEKTHCLVCAVDGNTISQLDTKIVDKIKQSYKTAAILGK